MNIIFFAVLILDQITKYLARTYLKGTSGINIIGEYFGLSYVENHGAAFGILQHQKLFFVITTLIVIIGIFYFMRKYRSRMGKALNIALVLILSGAVGNLIDRIFYSYVTDFFDIRFGSLYNFPVFNIADIAVVVGTVILIYLVITGKEGKQEE